MSETEQIAIQFLTTPRTCTELGEHLWGGKRSRQSYARPAGKVVSRLVAAGLASRAYPPGWRKRSPQWSATPRAVRMATGRLDPAEESRKNSEK